MNIYQRDETLYGGASAIGSLLNGYIGANTKKSFKKKKCPKCKKKKEVA